MRYGRGMAIALEKIKTINDDTAPVFLLLRGLQFAKFKIKDDRYKKPFCVCMEKR